MAFFKAYLDASGSARDPSIDALSFGGYVAHEDQWRDFEQKWPAVLNEFGITEFHMVHFAQSEGEFAKWKDKKWEPTRQAFIRAITQVINKCTVQQLGATVHLHAYRWFNERFHMEDVLGTPYGIAAMNALARVTEWKDRHSIKEPVLIFIEKGDNEQADFRKWIAGRIKWDSDDVAEPVFCRKGWTDAEGQVHYCLPFQASDFIAYEKAKAITDIIRYGKLDLRKSLLGLVRHGDPLMWSSVNRHTLWNSVKNFSVPQREDHPEVYMVPNGPLCYVGLGNPLPGTSGIFNN